MPKPTNKQFAETIKRAMAGSGFAPAPATIDPTRASATLPPDPEDMNDARAEWAGECISLMAEITGCENGQEALGDLLADMFHWCDRNGLDMEAMIERARRCYRDETLDV